MGLLPAVGQTGSITDDGAWCWFSDPRAIHLDDGQIMTGWVKKDGSVEIARLDLASERVETRILFPEMEIDDHNNPAFVRLGDGRFAAFYTWHSSKKGLVYSVSDVGGELSSFSDNVVIKPNFGNLLAAFPRETYTYANPYVLKSEADRLYCFGRWIGFKPNMIWSDDGGQTWSGQKVIISPQVFDPGNRPYVKYHSDGGSRIHLSYTDGHPRNEPFNGVYYCYYEEGAFWRADGSKISDVQDLPFAPEEGSLVYRPNERSGRAWLADMTADEDGRPVILYTRHPEEMDHRYRYAAYDPENGRWEDHEICQAGRWFPQTPPTVVEREPHYHGNMSIHPDDPRVIFLSRQINGTFEIEKRTTSDGGKSWSIEPLTQHSAADQVRPYVAKGMTDGAPTVVLWMENHRYVHYTDYDTRIKYWIDRP